jgi:uncharacterized protein (TIGR02246 family)
MDERDFKRWLDRYGEAWEARDARAAARLFTMDATYQWTPFDEPLEGREAIAEAWAAATSTQQDVRFTYQIVALEETQGVAHFHSKFQRKATGADVEIDGMLLAEFSDDGRCRRFREWWHRRGPA